ncbi:MAG: ABC transporter permease, partial [Candidatus Aminicenantaceae bacterium]
MTPYKDKFESMSKYVFPPVISLKQVTISKGEEKEDQMSVAGYVLPGMGIMFLLFICNVVFEDVLKEKEAGTLLRMNVSPLRLSEYVWSKILVSVTIGVVCTLFLVVLGAVIFSIHWGNIVVLILTILSLNLLIAGFISIFYSFIKTERQAGAVLSSVIIVMSLLGGSMVSVTQFPPLVQKISKITVNYWGIELF